MIHTCLSFLTSELNDYLKLRAGTPTVDWVFLTSVATEGGGVVIPNKSIGVSLINIEEDRIYKDQKSTIVNTRGNVESLNPEIKLNLYVLISANFQNNLNDDTSDDYVEGLKQLSWIISYFQAKNVFTPENSPQMAEFDPNLTKLVVELYSYSFEQLYNFWFSNKGKIEVFFSQICVFNFNHDFFAKLVTDACSFANQSIFRIIKFIMIVIHISN